MGTDSHGALTTASLATTLSAQGQYEEAAAMMRQTWDVQRRVLGAEHPGTLTTASNLAYALYRQGQLDEAAAMARQALDVQRRVLGAKHPNTLGTAKRLAVILRARNIAHLSLVVLFAVFLACLLFL